MSLNNLQPINPASVGNAAIPEKEAQESKKPKEKVEVPSKEPEHKDPNTILDALALSGTQNKTLMGLNVVDPTKFLTPERIKDIENSMVTFEKGVQQNLDIINAEMPEASEVFKNELAARMMI